jgi:hypothetical protein
MGRNDCGLTAVKCDVENRPAGYRLVGQPVHFARLKGIPQFREKAEGMRVNASLNG